MRNQFAHLSVFLRSIQVMTNLYEFVGLFRHLTQYQAINLPIHSLSTNLTASAFYSILSFNALGVINSNFIPPIKQSLACVIFQFLCTRL